MRATTQTVIIIAVNFQTVMATIPTIHSLEKVAAVIIMTQVMDNHHIIISHNTVVKTPMSQSMDRKSYKTVYQLHDLIHIVKNNTLSYRF